MILALIPAYNEAQQIAQVVAQTRSILPVVVVDDGSSDDTARLAEAAGAQVIRQQPNQGKGSALRAGFRAALSQGARAVITLDADGQHDPLEIPKFLDCYHTRHSDLIIGARNFAHMPISRRLANTFGRVTFSWAMGRPVRDNQSGYRLIQARLMQALLSSREQGFEFEVEMIAVCIRAGYSLDWVPVHTIYAGEASHIQPVKHIIHYLRILWKARRQVRLDRGTPG